IIHADLTGRNVLISSQKTEEEPRGFSAKVADFGFARYAVNGRALPTQVCHGSLKQADYRILNFEPIYARDIGTITHMPPELMDPDGG
ncbi:unnamed protein product, partial [Symbiodinium microadriaticum]